MGEDSSVVVDDADDMCVEGVEYMCFPFFVESEADVVMAHD